ncbi:MAG: tetratricopeptide repeat protein [Pseudomonadota bacterium]
MMNSRTLLSFGLSAVVLGGTMVGCAATQGTLPLGVSSAPNADAKRAAKEAADARKALADHKVDKGVALAEAAVAHDPRNSEHRALLGQAYLMAGRFTSARDALNDALALDPGNGRVALNFALSQIAVGDWAGARSTLDTHAADIPAGDRGLAYALAGDPMKALEVLEPAARAADASAKTRQNYALSLALAGRWREAQSVAAIDLPADQVDGRIRQWVAFARPTNAYDQVASLLGVRAVEDPGQPQQLALASTTTQMAAAAEPVQAVAAVDPYNSYGAPDTARVQEMPAGDAPARNLVVDDAAFASADAPVSQGFETAGNIVYAPRAEIVQPVPARRASAPPAPARVAAASSGGYYVQLGAYGSPSGARAAWNAASRRFPALASHAPSSVRVQSKAGTLYRLSVGGFARADATRMCDDIVRSGGKCFVRVQAGDQLASWGRKDQMAAR